MPSSPSPAGDITVPGAARQSYVIAVSSALDRWLASDMGEAASGVFFDEFRALSALHGRPGEFLGYAAVAARFIQQMLPTGVRLADLADNDDLYVALEGFTGGRQANIDVSACLDCREAMRFSVAVANTEWEFARDLYDTFTSPVGVLAALLAANTRGYLVCCEHHLTPLSGGN